MAPCCGTSEEDKINPVVMITVFGGRFDMGGIWMKKIHVETCSENGECMERKDMTDLQINKI